MMTGYWIPSRLIRVVLFVGFFFIPPRVSVAEYVLIPNPTGSEFVEKYNFKVLANESLNARWASLGPTQKALSYLKRFTPFLSSSYLCTAVDTRHTVFLLGNCLVDQSDHLHNLPISEFKNKYSTALQSLWSRSELDAITFSKAMFGQSTQDILVKNLLSILQIVALLTAIYLSLRCFGLKKTFIASLAISLAGGILLRLLLWSSVGNFLYFLYLHDLIELGMGALAAVLGLMLAARWIMRGPPRATGS